MDITSKYFHSLQAEEFFSSDAVCKAVQDYVFLSKYNLKRTAPNRKNIITFVCTCNSQKRNVPNFMDKNLEKQTIFDEKIFDTTTIGDSTTPTQISSSQVMATSFDQIDDSMEKIFLSQKRINSKERKIKRHNVQRCSFRLKFKQNKLTQTFQFSSHTFPHHNHPPDKSSTEVSTVK